MPNLWIATFNQGKIREFESLLKKLEGYELRSAGEYKHYRAPEENGSSFLENATIKAKSFKALVNTEDWVLAEDSGIEVEALDGLPGIHSARYAGPNAIDQQNNDKIFKMLNFKKTTNRNARYFCQIIALGPDNKKIEVSGSCEGKIALIPSGNKGFGYDPIFIPRDFSKTMAELLPFEKNKISHRAKATSEFIKKLNDMK